MSNCNINARIWFVGKSSESPPNSSPEIPSEFRGNLEYYVGDQKDREDYDNSIRSGGEIETVEATVSSRESEKNSIPGDEGNGFTTPTSTDHKIPPAAECPPAPMKRRFQHSKLKRVAPPACRRSLQFTGIESNLLPVKSECVEEIKRKKSRKGDGI